MKERTFYLHDIPLEEARQCLETALSETSRWRALAGESISLPEALGRVTAEPIWAKLSSPHYHASAMDGYAVLAEHTRDATETRPVTLNLNTQAIPVNTGDPLPADTNAVIMVEDVQEIGDSQIAIRAAVAPWKHVRLMGEDIVATELVLPINHRIRPVDLGALAGCGYANVTVRRKPQVAIIPTGSELVPVTETPIAGQIIEYNSLVLRGQLLEAGAQVSVMDIVPDDRERINEALRDALQQKPDLILILSGSSAGTKDFTAAIIKEMGTLLVHGVAVRPGHPVIIGMVDETPVFGIPGYPVSAALTGELFVVPLIRQWLGVELNKHGHSKVEAFITRKLLSPTGDDDFVRMTLAQVGERLLATPLKRGAGVITSLVQADGLLHVPRFSEGVNMGEQVTVQLLRPLSAIQRTLLVIGSHDPMLDLLGQYLVQQESAVRLIPVHVGSIGGLVALKRGEAHLAGIHLLDPETGQYNIPYVEKYLPGEALQLVTFAHREQGLIVAQGNPLNIQSIDDLLRVRYVNRQRGAGTRILLDHELQKRNIAPDDIAGYEQEAYTHLAAAAAVASGIADCGMGVRNAAIAMNLDFIPVTLECYDLVIPETHQDHPGVQALLALLHDAEFRQALQSMPGYETDETGIVQYVV